MIAQSQISKLSNRLHKQSGGRRIPEAVLERDYCVAWFLVGLSRSPLKTKLAFKGGTALKRCHFEDYRFSEDMDFTLLETTTLEAIKKELETIYTEVKTASGIAFRFVREDSQPHQNCHTFYLGYEGPLPATAAGKEIKVDITIKEHLAHPPEERVVLKSYAEYNDLPDGAKVLAYSLGEIAAEKTAALLDRARSEPRDLYDLWHLTVSSKSVEPAQIADAIRAKLAFRNKSLDEVRGEYDKKEPRLRKAWESRLSMQMSTLPEFDHVYRAVKRVLRQAGIAAE
ncbi:MAG: nucleotidyl transferase AbiEii/AbiGii toxin family protein [Deltaproteobacteria bacterium]|nr:nucleotidyl transferase AbiEii/AbiGii toxin family protein [Deltaproteobacteria bacterium]